MSNDARAREGEELDFVYVTLGTVTPTIPVLLPWYSVLLEALDGLPVSALMTVGRSLEPLSVGPVPPNVEVTQWADQRAAMARAAAVVHHGGSGTVLTRSSGRVPSSWCPFSRTKWTTRPWSNGKA